MPLLIIFKSRFAVADANNVVVKAAKPAWVVQDILESFLKCILYVQTFHKMESLNNVTMFLLC